MLTICLVIIIVIGFLEWFLNGRNRARLFWKIEGPKGSLIFGNCLQVVATPVNLFRNLRLWASTYKNRYRQWIFLIGVIHIYNPEDIEIILSNSRYNEKSLLYNFLRPWLSDGLLLSKDAKWQVRRKILTPAFHFNILQVFSTIIEENSRRMANTLENETQQAKTNIIPILSDVTLNSICETSMGVKLENDQSGAANTYKNAIHEIGKLIIYRIARSWLTSDFIFNLTKQGKRQKQILNIIHNFPKNVIEERRQYVKEHGLEIVETTLNENDVIGVFPRRMALLDILLAAERDGLIDDAGIQEEVDTFMFEGHDTTAMGLTYALMELANNRKIQDAVFDELNKVFGGSDRPARMRDLLEMKYLECCIKETLRLYPPVPFISRYVNDDLLLGDNTAIPKGDTLCHIHIFDLHRREDIYEEPLVFKPERFLPENCISRHPYAYIPFSAGSRNCIGQKFAMLEMKSVLAAILRRFVILPVTKPADLEFTADLVLRTTHPIFVKFKSRQKS